MVTKEERRAWAENEVSKLTVTLRHGEVPLVEGGEVLERFNFEWTPLLALVQMPAPNDCFRVVQALPYVNRAIRPQIDVFMKDFVDRDEAETLLLEAAEGHLAFGDLWRLSVGSGLRHIEAVD